MKKISLLFFLLAATLSGVFFTSCEKEGNMIVRKWSLESKTVAGINVTTDCELGAKWDFKSDGTYAIMDACDKTKTGTWSLAVDNTTLTMDNVTTYQVDKNSITTLVIEMVVAGVEVARWEFK